MATTKLLLVTAEVLEVEGDPEDVARVLENSARSSHGTLARLVDATSRQHLGVNAAHVVTVSPGSG